MIRTIDDPQQCFARLGGLHDSPLESFGWDRAGNDFAIKLKDLFTNFKGTDQDVGRLPGVLTFKEVSAIDVAVDPLTDMLWVYDLETQLVGVEMLFNVSLSPGGHIRVRCKRIELSTVAPLEEGMLELVGF